MDARAGSITLFGLQFRDVSLAEAADDLVERARTGKGVRINFVNAHCVNVAAGDNDYLRALERTDLLYADGIGMAIAARLAGTGFRDNVNGTDLFVPVCERAARGGLRIGLLGARPGVAEACAREMCRRVPGLSIAYVRDGYMAAEEEGGIVAAINEAEVDILYVAMGVPRQELFIDKWSERLDVGVMLGVGALLDYYSGTVRRAPLWLRHLRCEWIYRLLLEPRRLFMRYVVGNVTFLLRALWRRFGGRLVSGRLGPD